MLSIPLERTHVHGNKMTYDTQRSLQRTEADRVHRLLLGGMRHYYLLLIHPISSPLKDRRLHTLAVPGSIWVRCRHIPKASIFL